MAKLLTVAGIIAGMFLFLACDNSTKTAREADIVSDADTSEDVDITVPDDMLDETADESADEAFDATPDEDASGFDPTNPGYNIFFQIMTMEIFGQVNAMAFGVIMKTAREDLEPTDETGLELDTCVFESGTETPTPECSSKEDCAPEQECVAETDRNGKPIPGSEHCETPNRESLDRGPVTITGFVGGPAAFLYEPNDKVYKLNGTGDGSISLDMLAFNTDYTLSGEGQDDLAPFSAAVRFPPSLALVSPEPQTGGALPFPSVTIDPSQDLTIIWEEANPGNALDLTITGQEGSIVCRVKDDGEFTVSADLLSQVTFGTGFYAMANNLMLDRRFTRPMTGASVTAGSFNTEEMIIYIINVEGGY